MARLTKDKKRILDDQLAFNFEENTVEHYYIEKPKKKIEKIIKPKKKVFRKEFVAIKKSHKKRKQHGFDSRKNKQKNRVDK